MTKVEAFVPQPFTVLGWQVNDIQATVKELTAKGVQFERYGFLEQIYVELLARVLRKLGHGVEREVHVPVHFQNEVVGLHPLNGTGVTPPQR